MSITFKLYLYLIKQSQKLNKMKTVKSNQTLTSRSICDYDCIFNLTVIERKGNFASIKFMGNEKELKYGLIQTATNIYSQIIIQWLPDLKLLINHLKPHKMKTTAQQPTNSDILKASSYIFASFVVSVLLLAGADLIDQLMIWLF